MTPQSATESQIVNCRKADEVFAEDAGELGFFMTLAFGSAGLAIDRFFEWNNANPPAPDAVGWIVIFILASAVFGVLAYRKRGDIDGLAEAIRRESTDVTPPTPSGTDT